MVDWPKLWMRRSEATLGSHCFRFAIDVVRRPVTSRCLAVWPRGHCRGYRLTLTHVGGRRVSVMSNKMGVSVAKAAS
jgi:hypothetical protein